MSDANSLDCWICAERPADFAEPTAKARGADGLALAGSVCSHCNTAGTRLYAESWQRLSSYLHTNWRDITARGSFDLSKVFGAETSTHAVRIQLHFVKLLGCKLAADQIRVDLRSFSQALRTGTPHPEVALLVANSHVPAGQLRSYDSSVSVLRNGEEVYSAVWMELVHPIGIKICYLKKGAPVREPPGFPWHPARQKKIVKLSPYKGDTEPLVARRDLRI